MEQSPAYNQDSYVDSHQHFWRYDKIKHSWITDEMAVIRRDFLPADLYLQLAENGVQGCVAVQADQTAEETAYLLQLAIENTFIRGVVGWVDLRAKEIADSLQYYKRFPALKGFRHILQGEAPEFMLQPAFVHGISLLEALDFTYDILIHPQHLTAACQMVKQFPYQRFVVDHLAKPYIKSGAIDEWKRDIGIISQYPNVNCKISGMVTEADPSNWRQQQFNPYIDAVVEAFGMKRLLYGSDWPVCLVGGSYEQVINIVKEYFSAFSADEKAFVFGRNATAFYNL